MGRPDWAERERWTSPQYDLPEEAIAQVPGRTAGRGPPARRPRPGRPARPGVGPAEPPRRRATCLVVNNSRVVPARLRLQKATGGAAEVLLLEPWPEPPAHLGSPGAPGPQAGARDRAVRGRASPSWRSGKRLPEGARLVRAWSTTWARSARLALPPYITSPARRRRPLPDGVRRPSRERGRTDGRAAPHSTSARRVRRSVGRPSPISTWPSGWARSGR